MSILNFILKQSSNNQPDNQSTTIFEPQPLFYILLAIFFAISIAFVIFVIYQVKRENKNKTENKNIKKDI